jgi:predicted TPR repeat methyltransferase
MGATFIDKIYRGDAPEDVAALYAAWAATYETEIQDNGYATPARCARALLRHTANTAAPVLDYGCGTGLSGLALRMAGFETLDGVDISPEMLAQAEAKGMYRRLTRIAPDTGFDQIAEYETVTAIGLLGPGGAPAEVLDTLISGLARGAKLVFSLNDHAIAEKTYEGRLSEHMDYGGIRLLMRDYGPHLPAQNLKSYIYVIEKA